MNDLEFGDRLRQLLEENNMTQQRLASELNLVPSTLNGYIKKNRIPEYAILVKISRLFNTTCDYLIGNSVRKQENGNTINSAEDRIVEIYRKLDDKGKEILEDEMMLIYRHFKSEEN